MDLSASEAVSIFDLESAYVVASTYGGVLLAVFFVLGMGWSVTSMTDGVSESDSISIGVCLEYPCSPRGAAGAAGGGDARGSGLRDFGRVMEDGSTTLAGGATNDVLADGSSTSSPLDGVYRSEFGTFGDVLISDGDGRVPVSSFLNMKYHGHDFWKSSGMSAMSCMKKGYVLDLRLSG